MPSNRHAETARSPRERLRLTGANAFRVNATVEQQVTATARAEQKRARKGLKRLQDAARSGVLPPETIYADEELRAMGSDQ